MTLWKAHRGIEITKYCLLSLVDLTSLHAAWTSRKTVGSAKNNPILTFSHGVRNSQEDIVSPLNYNRNHHHHHYHNNDWRLRRRYVVQWMLLVWTRAGRAGMFRRSRLPQQSTTWVPMCPSMQTRTWQKWFSYERTVPPHT